MLVVDPPSAETTTPAHIFIAERRDRADLQIFKQVVSMFAELRTLPPVVASSPDRDSVRGSIKWSPILFMFLHDTENATRAALGDHLTETWMELVATDSDMWGAVFDRDVLLQIVRRCARVYRERGLRPTKYFTPNRHPGRA